MLTNGVRIVLHLMLIDAYFNFTLAKSLLKLDLINCIAFMTTSIFIWYTVEEKDSNDN